MKTYAVRQKSTGLFIPRLPNGKRRGGTRLEPSDERELRLFPNKRSVAAFLANWLQGIMYIKLDHEGEPDLVITKQSHRNKADMEIVEFDLIEVKQ